jgi:hypothetical protein
VTALTRSLQPRLQGLQLSPPLLIALGGGIIAAAVGVAVGSSPRVAIAVTVVTVLVSMVTTAPALGLNALVLWLMVLGFVRRWLSDFAPVVELDPLLTIGPVVLTALVFMSVQAGAFRNRTTLSTAVLVFTALSFAAAVNPLQGSVAAGLAGLLFFVVPTLGFWVGRSLLTDRQLGQLLTLVAILGLAAALYGLRQTFWGFPDWDEAWIRSSGYEALNVGSAVRPFGPLSSASEYAFVIAIAIVIVFARGMRRGRLVLGAGALGVLFVAVFLASARGVIFALLVALAAMAAARGRLSWRTALLAAAVLVLVLPALAARLAPAAAGAGEAGELLNHQIEGLSDPFDPESSTLLIHLEIMERGLQSALSEPLGVGIGAVGIAAEKFGGLSLGTEADPSNVAVGLGLPGLTVFAIILFVGLQQAYGLARDRGDPLALAVLGIVVATVLQWLNGGHYAVALLSWLMLGWVDRTRREGR